MEADTSVPAVDKEQVKFNTYYLFSISAVSALGGLLFGFDISVISGTIPFITTYFNLTDVTLGWAVSSALIGCILGTFLAGKPSEMFGRKKLLMLAAVFFTISAIGVGLSWSLSSFAVLRLVGGLGVGMASTLSPAYISEIAPASIRGRFVSLNQLTIVIGILAAYFSNYFLSDVAHNWRWMYASEAIPAILFFIGLFFVPESPRWLIRNGRDGEARAIFKKIGGASFATSVIQDIKRSIAKNTKGNLKDLLQPDLRFVVMVGIILAIFQQWCGINVIFFYATDIFKSAGAGVHASLYQTIFIGVVNLTFTVLAMWLVDWVGRKKLLVFGVAGMIISYLLIGLCFYIPSFGGVYLVLFVLCVVGFYATSLAPVTWVLISEIYPNRIRGVAMSVATFFLWVASFILTLTFPILRTNFGEAYTFWLYAAICLTGWIFILFCVPETKGKSLEELEEILIQP